MMRSLYSGVAGLKIHQTKMDVIGNNIANVNTVGFKSSSVNFSDTFYQTVSGASGPNADVDAAGTNAKQIGLGGLVASITTNITENGGTTTTNRALDVAINGEAFMVVKINGVQRFTKSGAMNVDPAGNLYCTTNAGIVQGWLANDDGEIVKDIATDLKVMTTELTSAEPAATTFETMLGNIDPNDKNLVPSTDVTGNMTGGVPMTYSFYDKVGELYTVKMLVTKDPGLSSDPTTVPYTVRIADVFNSKGKSVFVTETANPDGSISYSDSGAKITFGSGVTPVGVASGGVNATTGEFSLDASLKQPLLFNSSTGGFASVGGDRANSDYKGKSVNFSVVQVSTDHTGENSSFPQYDATLDNGGVEIDFTSLTQFTKGGTSELSYKRGDSDGDRAGNYAGTMSGLSVDESGKVFGKYTNGVTKCLAQICVATFANPSGLEAVGDSLFAESLNSGVFDGVGEEISTSGSFSVGALEMSNVDLASEFTNMITTQRGFQANSRIITTSDSMLEELVNLKR